MSSAAIEYYGYLLSQGYGEDQIKTFADLAGQADRGEISHNQAYKEACKNGFANAEGDKRSFGDWMTTAQDEGWIDKGIQILGGFIGKNRGGQSSAELQAQLAAQAEAEARAKSRRTNTILIIGGIAIVGITMAIIISRKKK